MEVALSNMRSKNNNKKPSGRPSSLRTLGESNISLSLVGVVALVMRCLGFSFTLTDAGRRRNEEKQ